MVMEIEDVREIDFKGIMVNLLIVKGRNEDEFKSQSSDDKKYLMFWESRIFMRFQGNVEGGGVGCRVWY